MSILDRPAESVTSHIPFSKVRTIAPATQVECALLLGTISILPLEHHLPTIRGVSVLWLAFACLGAYLSFYRFEEVLYVAQHSVFLSAYLFVGMAVFVESLHESPDYAVMIRIFQMIAGAVLIAALCRTDKALRASLYGVLLAGLWLSLLMWFTTYDTLSSATAEGFGEATRIRRAAFEEFGLAANLNQLSYVAGQGAVVALALALTAHDPPTRWLFLGLTVTCLIAVFLPLSRSGIGITLVTFALVMAKSIRNFKNLPVVLAILLLAIVCLVPDVAWERFSISMQSDSRGRMESRARVYTACFENLEKYIVFGVGAGNFMEQWGWENGFAHNGLLAGAHNCYFQTAICWGLPGLLALLLLIYNARHCLPHIHARSESLALLGLAWSALFLTMFMHNLYSKSFSVVLGLLVGSSLWIWPSRIVSRSTQP